MELGTSRAIVTGAASGLGRAFCEGLLRAGASVAALDKDRRGLERLAAEVPHDGKRLSTHPADVTREDEVKAAVDHAFDELGRADLLINSAGIYRDGLLVKDTGDGLLTMPSGQWRTVVDTDLTGTFLMCRQVARRMVEKGVRPGLLINISSVTRSGNPGQGNYTAAKSGVVSFTRSIALELAPHGIRAAAVAPGFTDTPILQAMDPQRLSEQIEEIPLRRLGTPDEIYAGVRFVVECEYFNGKCLEIDGGLAI
jgi:3-oxoacyl-[acyl-carrier protein] reductase